MGRAYLCDRCGDFYEGTPHKHLAWGPTPSSAQSRVEHEEELNWALCEPCAQSFTDWLDQRDAPQLTQPEEESNE